MADVQFQVRQIQSYLSSNFFEHINFTEVELRSTAERLEQFRFSRSLVGAFLCMHTDVSPELSCRYITDGYDDNGIDGFYYDSSDNTLYIVQAKFSRKGEAVFEVADAHKFLTGVKDLIAARFEKFGKAIRNRRDEIERVLDSAGGKVSIVLAIVATSSQPLSPHAKDLLDDFIRQENQWAETFSLSYTSNKQLYKFISSGAFGGPINSDIVLHSCVQLLTPIRSFFGQMAGSDLGRLYRDHGKRLFAPNIRVYLQKTEVNDAIIETIVKSPEKFWYYNNGITIICDKIERKVIGGSTEPTAYLEGVNIQIVNGAQTVGAIAKAQKTHPENAERVKVWTRIIEIGPSDNEEAKKITRTNNTQNRIDSRDFVSLDPVQQNIREQLRLDKIDYVFKSGESPDHLNDSFDLTAATIARACVQPDIQFSVQAKREISKLWSEIDRPPYTILFNKRIQPLKLYWEINILRQVDKQVALGSKQLAGRDRVIMIQGNRFLLFLVFRYLDMNGQLYNQVEEIAIASIFQLAFEALKQHIPTSVSDIQLSNLFKNLSHCERIYHDISVSDFGRKNIKSRPLKIDFPLQ